MGTKTGSIHEQVMENTKRLSFRAQAMAFQLEKARKEKQSKVLTYARSSLHKATEMCTFRRLGADSSRRPMVSDLFFL